MPAAAHGQVCGSQSGGAEGFTLDTMEALDPGRRGRGLCSLVDDGALQHLVHHVLFVHIVIHEGVVGKLVPALDVLHEVGAAVVGVSQGIEAQIGQTTDLVSMLWDNLQCSTSPS